MHERMHHLHANMVTKALPEKSMNNFFQYMKGFTLVKNLNKRSVTKSFQQQKLTAIFTSKKL